MDVSNAVDRRTKMEADKWDEYVLAMGIDQNQLDGLKKILADYDLWQKSEELVRLFKALEALGVKDYVKFDPNIMRGLLYYTGTVFEAFDVSGSVRRAILGGGRYDNLLRDVGGDPLSGVGFAMGDVVIGIILREKSLIPAFIPTPAPVLLTVFDETLWMDSFGLAAELRQTGIYVTVFPEPAKLAKQFKYGDRMGMKIVLVIGPDESAAGKVTVKDLKNGVQELVLRSEVKNSIIKILKNE